MKICNVCKKEKELSRFRTGARRCYDCDRDIHRTPLGLAKRIWHSQNRLSKRRGHNPPEYTKLEFIDWFLNHEKFPKLYNDWKESGYERLKRPSADRLRDESGYSFDNIQLITFFENVSKPNYPRLTKIERNK